MGADQSGGVPGRVVPRQGKKSGARLKKERMTRWGKKWYVDGRKEGRLSGLGEKECQVKEGVPG